MTNSHDSISRDTDGQDAECAECGGTTACPEAADNHPPEPAIKRFARIMPKAVMLVAAWSMVMTPIVPSVAQAQSKADIQVDMQKVNQCISRMNAQKGKTRNVPDVVVQAAERICWVTQDPDAGAGKVMEFGVPGIEKAFQKGQQKIQEQGFSGMKSEPGLLGLAGAEDVIRSMLENEARGLWIMAAVAGGPSVPGQEQGTNNTSSSSAGDLKIVQSTTVKAMGNYFQEYANAYIDALKKSPDDMILLKARVYQKLQSIALASPSKRTKSEQLFLDSFNKYLRDQYTYMAQTALDKYNDYMRLSEIRHEERSTAMTFTLGNYDYPPDYLDEMRAAAMLSAQGIAVAATIGAFAAHASASATAATASAFANAAATSAMAANAVGNTALAAQSGMVAAQASSMASSASAAAGAASAGGAVAIVAIGAVIIVMVGSKVIKHEKLQKEMNEALAWAKSGRVNMRDFLATREGTMAVQHFFAKATSTQSPSDYESQTDQCGACFFAKKNFEGDQFCTQGKEDDLRHLGTDGANMTHKISSVAIAQGTCKNSNVVLWDGRRHQGEKIIINSSVADLSQLSRKGLGNWNDAAGSVAFSDLDAPKCEVCFYARTGYQGRMVCSSGGIANLGAFNMNETIASLKMNTASCRGAKAWLYKKKEYKKDKNGEGYMIATKDIQALDGAFRNKVSSIYFSQDGTNPFEMAAAGGCRACLYDRPDFKGEYMCVNHNIPDMNAVEVAGEQVKFRNMTTSVQFIKDDCKPGEQLVLELYNRPNYQGNMTRIIGEDVRELTGGENNNAASAKLIHIDPKVAANRCEVCFFKDKNYQGDATCTKGDLSVMPQGFRDSISSLRVENAGCKTGGVMIYGARNFDGKIESFMKNVPDLSAHKKDRLTNWNNAVSSAKFVRNLEAARRQATAGLKALGIDTSPQPTQTPTQTIQSAVQASQESRGCRVCLYKDLNYSGTEWCTDNEISSLPTMIRNSASSIKIETASCPKGGAYIFARVNYQGGSTHILGNNPDLRKLAKSTGGNFNDTIASIKWSPTLRDAVENAQKATDAAEKGVTNTLQQMFGN